MALPKPYATNVTVPLPSEDHVRQIAGSAYKPDALNIVKMFAGTDDMFPACVQFVKVVFQEKSISDKCREMIILRSAAIMNSPYEWQANAKMASNVGLTEDEINAAAADGAVSEVDPEYVLLCRATDELSLKATLTDETLSSLLERYGDTLARKYILTVSWFNLLTRYLNGCRVPMETTDKIGNKTSPL